MSISDLKNHLKQNAFAPVYLFYGPEQYLQNHYLSLLRKKLVEPQFAAFNDHRISGRAFDCEQFAAAVQSYPTFSEHKLVVVEELQGTVLTESKTQIAAALEQTAAGVCVVFCYDAQTDLSAKTNAIRKFFAGVGAVEVEFLEPSESDLSAWVTRHVAAHRKKIDLPVVQYLLSVCDNDMTALLQEIEKLCSYSTRDQITREHIDRVVTFSVDARVYALADALGAGHYDEAFQTLHTLCDMKYEPVYLLGTISSTFCGLKKCKAAQAAGLPRSEAMERCGIKTPFVFDKYSRLCQQFSMRFLNRAVRCCADADLELKSSPMQKQLILELLLGRLMEQDGRVTG